MLLELWDFGIVLSDLIDLVVSCASHVRSELVSLPLVGCLVIFIFIGYIVWRSTEIPDLPLPPRPPYVIQIHGATTTIGLGTSVNNNNNRRQTISDVHLLNSGPYVESVLRHFPQHRQQQQQVQQQQTGESATVNQNTTAGGSGHRISLLFRFLRPTNGRRVRPSNTTTTTTGGSRGFLTNIAPNLIVYHQVNVYHHNVTHSSTGSNNTTTNTSTVTSSTTPIPSSSEGSNNSNSQQQSSTSGDIIVLSPESPTSTTTTASSTTTTIPTNLRQREEEENTTIGISLQDLVQVGATTALLDNNDASQRLTNESDIRSGSISSLNATNDAEEQIVVSQQEDENNEQMNAIIDSNNPNSSSSIVSGNSSAMDESSLSKEGTSSNKEQENPVRDDSQDVKFTIKFLNDTQMEVTSQMTEKIGDLKRRHFAREMSENKTVRLIFNGRVLDNENKTLRESGIFDHCVVHCLIVTRQQTGDNSTSGGNGMQTGGETSNQFNSGGIGTGTGTGRRSGPEPGMFFIAIMGIILTFLWFICFHFGQQLFTQSAVVSLTVLTAIFLIGLVAFYLPIHPNN